MKGQTPVDLFPTDVERSEFLTNSDCPAGLGFLAKQEILRSDGGLRLAPFLAQIEAFLIPSRDGGGGGAWRRTHEKVIPVARPGSSSDRVDVGIVGECKRASEIQLMMNVLRGLFAEGASIGYFVEFGTAEYEALIRHYEARIHDGQLKVIDLYCGHRTTGYALRHPETLADAFAIRSAIAERLPAGLALTAGAYAPIWRLCVKAAAWRHARSRLKFPRLVVRNHFSGLAAHAAFDSVESAVDVSTFQHGLVSTPASFLPLLARRFFGLGPGSCDVVRRQDRRLWAGTSTSGYCTTFVAAGSLLDPIAQIGSAGARDTMLVIDQHARWAEEFYGIATQLKEFRAAVAGILRKSSAVKRAIIRMHPNALREAPWSEVQSEFGERVEISGSRPFAEDLRRASVAIGMFSGALASAAASGVPTVFLWKKGWLYMPELSPFVSSCFSPVEGAQQRVEKILTNEETWRYASELAAASGRTFFGDSVHGWSLAVRSILHG